jgi:uncharacterized UBP type Zn finger protein
MTDSCTHITEIIEVAPALEVCESCVEIGSQWFHLRQCLMCGRTGCCDESPNRHASGHARETGHAIARSAEPGEDWAWCYVDEVPFLPGPGGWELAEA